MQHPFSATNRIQAVKGNHKMLNLLIKLHKEEGGQDLIEYALVGLIVALGSLTGMGKLSSSINFEFSKISTKLT